MGTILPNVQQILGTLPHFRFNVILSAKPLWPNTTTETLYVKRLPTP